MRTVKRQVYASNRCLEWRSAIEVLRLLGERRRVILRVQTQSLYHSLGTTWKLLGEGKDDSVRSVGEVQKAPEIRLVKNAQPNHADHAMGQLSLVLDLFQYPGLGRAENAFRKSYSVPDFFIKRSWRGRLTLTTISFKHSYRCMKTHISCI